MIVIYFIINITSSSFSFLYHRNINIPKHNINKKLKYDKTFKTKSYFLLIFNFYNNNKDIFIYTIPLNHFVFYLFKY